MLLTVDIALKVTTGICKQPRYDLIQMSELILKKAYRRWISRKDNNNAVEVSQQTPETDIGSRSGQHNPWARVALLWPNTIEKADLNKLSIMIDQQNNNKKTVKVSQRTPETDIRSRSSQHNPWGGHVTWSHDLISFWYAFDEDNITGDMIQIRKVGKNKFISV